MAADSSRAPCFSTFASVSAMSSPSNDARAGEHLVEHAAERPHVRSFVRRFASRLLGRHVGGGAEERTNAGHERRARDRRRE